MATTISISFNTGAPGIGQGGVGNPATCTVTGGTMTSLNNITWTGVTGNGQINGVGYFGGVSYYASATTGVWYGFQYAGATPAACKLQFALNAGVLTLQYLGYYYPISNIMSTSTTPAQNDTAWALGGTVNNPYWFTVGTGTFTQIVPPPCFVMGTRIRMAGGAEKAIEDIQEGERVDTLHGKPEAVVEVTHTRCEVRADTIQDVAPYRIPAGVLGAVHDLRLSPRHGVLVNRSKVPAAAVEGAVQERVALGESVRYYHLRLADGVNTCVYAEGVPCETLMPMNS